MKTQKNPVTLLIVFSIWLGLILGCKTSPQSEATNPITISAEDLYKAYQSNEAEGDELYKGKMLIVTGTVGRAETRTREVTLVDALHRHIVLCAGFATDQEDTISKLKAGQTVSVKGKCVGRAHVLGMSIEQVALQDCVVQ